MRCKQRDNIEICYWRGNQSTPQSRYDLLANKVGVQGYQKDPPSLIYPQYLNPPSSSSQRTSQSHFFISYPNPKISSKLHLLINGFFQYFPHAPKLLSTLRLGEVHGCQNCDLDRRIAQFYDPTSPKHLGSH